ncbi:DUF7344 domain-containing protein [Haloarchaeobius salinus]|uniref:DUF7344 domain-containing protein n=1 Tax=Haloarchaeobius salinus TaxID=1198298 RepID=UPI00210F0C3B|nr:hypothetical protein [Haloarchaeobius salinus]
MDDTDPQVSVGKDRLLALLSNCRRRQALATLATEDEPLTVEELTERLPAIDESEADRVQLELHHNHLPKLARAGLVEYETGSQSATLARSPAEVATDIELAAATLHELVVVTRDAD